MHLTLRMSCVLLVVVIAAVACGSVSNQKNDASMSPSNGPCILDTSKVDNCTL